MKNFLALLLLLVSVSVSATPFTLKWEIPTERDACAAPKGASASNCSTWESLPLSEIKGYSIHYGTTSGVYNDKVWISSNTDVTATLDLPFSTNYYFVMTTTDTQNRVSRYSNEIQRSTINTSKPSKPTFTFGVPTVPTVPTVPGVLADLEGTAPQEFTITLAVNKPSNAISGIMVLDVYDPDFIDEGELIINGNPAIILFGSEGGAVHDAKRVNISFATPAAYWKDGDNTLLFKHTKTAGYKIYNVAVTFEVDETIVIDNSGVLPVSLSATAPEEATITFAVSKPSTTSNSIITLNVTDPDFKDEGELIINGNPAIILFGIEGGAVHDAKTVSLSFTVPSSYWKDGDNTLLFKHTKTGGYIINDIIITFE